LPDLTGVKSGRACLPLAGAFRASPVRRGLIYGPLSWLIPPCPSACAFGQPSRKTLPRSVFRDGCPRGDQHLVAPGILAQPDHAGANIWKRPPDRKGHAPVERGPVRCPKAQAAGQGGAKLGPTPVNPAAPAKGQAGAAGFDAGQIRQEKKRSPNAGTI